MRIARCLITLVFVLGVAAACGGGAAPSTSASPSFGGVSVGLSDYKFAPADVTFPANTKFTLRLTNTGSVEHNFAVADLGIDFVVPPDKKAHDHDIGPLAKTGTFDLICTVAGHKELGMKGTVTVK